LQAFWRCVQYKGKAGKRSLFTQFGAGLESLDMKGKALNIFGAVLLENQMPSFMHSFVQQRLIISFFSKSLDI